MQPALALAVLIVAASGAAADLYAQVGTAALAAAVALQNVNITARAFHGHSVTEHQNLDDVSASDRLKFAAELRDELAKIFADRPEQLEKIQQVIIAVSTALC
jgi:hypothetical protein